MALNTRNSVPENFVLAGEPRTVTTHCTVECAAMTVDPLLSVAERR